MNFFDLACFIAGVAGFAAAASFRWYANRVDERAEAVRKHGQAVSDQATLFQRFLDVLTEFQAFQLSITWNGGRKQWDVWRTDYNEFNWNRLQLCSDENWSVAVQNAVHLERARLANLGGPELKTFATPQVKPK